MKMTQMDMFAPKNAGMYKNKVLIISCF